MKTKYYKRYLLFTFLGICLLVLGAILAKMDINLPVIIETLPYILVGIGAGIFGQNLGSVLMIRSFKKDPMLEKKYEIDLKDERNNSIRDRAKAKSYDLMVKVFGVLLLVLALINKDLTIVLLVVFAYVIVVYSNVYYLTRLNKEM